MVSKVVMALNEYKEMENHVVWRNRIINKLRDCYSLESSVTKNDITQIRISVDKAKIEKLIAELYEELLGICPGDVFTIEWI